MNILHPGSLLATLDCFNDAVFWNRDWTGEAADLAEWTSSRLGQPGGYAGSFAMTDDDWNRDFRLYTGESVTTRAGRSHLIAQESTRMLLLLQKHLRSSIPALAIAEERLGNCIFQSENSVAAVSGFFCCGTCSVSLWRCLTAGGYRAWTGTLAAGLVTLGQHRQENGGWRRFPFHYTLLALLEAGEVGRPELALQADSLRRKLRAAGRGAEPFASRKKELLRRIVSK